jgi:hypothetical protein
VQEKILGLRYGINNYRKLPPYRKPFDIIASPKFEVANEEYKAAV